MMAALSYQPLPKESKPKTSFVSRRLGLAGLVVATVAFWAVTLSQEASMEKTEGMRALMYDDEMLESMDPTFVAQLLEQRRVEQEKKTLSGFLYHTFFARIFSERGNPRPPTNNFAFDAVFGPNMVLQHGSKAAVYGFLGAKCG